MIQKEYLKNSKKTYWYSSLLTFCTGIGAAALGLIFTKKIDNNYIRYGIGAAAGIISGVAATIFYNKSEIKNHKNFLDSYEASEIDYNKPKLPI